MGQGNDEGSGLKDFLCSAVAGLAFKGHVAALPAKLRGSGVQSQLDAFRVEAGVKPAHHPVVTRQNTKLAGAGTRFFIASGQRWSTDLRGVRRMVAFDKIEKHRAHLTGRALALEILRQGEVFVLTVRFAVN